jgi:uncharacterized membrane protein YesL
MIEAVSTSETSVNFYQIIGSTSQMTAIFIHVTFQVSIASIIALMEAIYTFEMLVNFNVATRCYIPED